jgi:hypothetical protein
MGREDDFVSIFIRELLKIDFNREGREGREECEEPEWHDVLFIHIL